MKVKIVRISDDHLLNIRYTDELIASSDPGSLKDEAECEKAERAIKTVGRYYLSADLMLVRL